MNFRELAGALERATHAQSCRLTAALLVQLIPQPQGEHAGSHADLMPGSINASCPPSREPSRDSLSGIDGYSHTGFGPTAAPAQTPDCVNA